MEGVVRITPEGRKMAVKAVKILGLDVGGVDSIRSNRGPLLLEVNSSPGLKGIEDATATGDCCKIPISAFSLSNIDLTYAQ